MATSAWSDDYEEHNTTDTNAEPFTGQTNVTVSSYGNLFMDAFYNAADCARLGEGALQETGYGDEDLTDRTFNFRLKARPCGPPQPLDLAKLLDIVFSTFFQNYASTNVTINEGGRVFQHIGATLPAGLPAIVNVSGGGLSSYQNTNVPSYINKTIEAVIHTKVEQLVMSPASVILCLTILVFLACTTVLVYFPYAAYFKALPRDVDTLASVIAFVYDSPRLREWIMNNEDLLDGKKSRGRSRGKLAQNAAAKQHGGKYKVVRMGEGDNSADALDEPTTGLGFFRGDKGIARWGIELEPVLRGNPGIRTPRLLLMRLSKDF
ncbi:hypothetical protein MMC08_007785 [Hypocenomyce scalaris]|nr:hypothetical protein [Hypocenomyce scalaris]